MVKITEGRYPDGRRAILVAAPFHPAWASRARALGGRWNPDRRVWVFDARDEGEVRALCIDIYGTDGRAPVELVDVELDLLGAESSPDQMSIWFAGRQIARVFGRDSGARLGEGVRLLRGSLDSGGSRNNPHVKWSPGTTVLIRDVPRSLITESKYVRIVGSTSPTGGDVDSATEREAQNG